TVLRKPRSRVRRRVTDDGLDGLAICGARRSGENDQKTSCAANSLSKIRCSRTLVRSHHRVPSSALGLLHADALVGAPGPDLGNVALVELPHSDARDLAGTR